jgi:hypothetical protein
MTIPSPVVPDVPAFDHVRAGVFAIGIGGAGRLTSQAPFP